ncbi:alpha/beta hydrolase [Paenibacillus alkalitolerans]|uniref:alpha/beta hydrolase n=1 Tax=Paenibacillus alkalitolerans TaxID=2799335 RepID=UPI0018F52AD6|nr:alpha/beta hydrolase family protein [Paenibacillus alkalitolerans]
MAWLHVHYHSEVLRMPVSMEVLLPQHVAGGWRSVNDPGPYPALYLLHGMSDDHTAWMRRTSIERYVEDKPISVVMPAAHLSWYTDMAFGREYFRFITEELPAFCERMYPISSAREDRFIAGLSMGGYGAMKAALNAPERYSAAASFSGEMDALKTYDRLPSQLSSDIFGSRERLEGGVNDLFASASRLAASDGPRPNLYMWCGTEDFLHEENVRFQQHAKSLGLPLEYEEGPGGHSWQCWDTCIERTIPWLLQHLSVEGGK